MKKNNVWKFVLAPAVVMIIGSALWFFYYTVVVNATDRNMQVILDHMNSAGVIVDIQNEIAVNGVEDLKLYVTDKEIEIEFGRLTLEWTPEVFAQPETQQKLSMIGITYKVYGEPKKLHVFWHDEEIERWVK